MIFGGMLDNVNLSRHQMALVQKILLDRHVLCLKVLSKKTCNVDEEFKEQVLQTMRRDKITVTL